MEKSLLRLPLETTDHNTAEMCANIPSPTASRTGVPGRPLSFSSTSPVFDPSNFPQTLATTTIYISLVYDPLDTTAYTSFTRSPTAGANVLFLGTTRNNFDGRPVSRLSYSAYPSMALKSLYAIAEDAKKRYQLEKVVIVHRLGEVNVEEESIAVSVSSAHRASC
ncbi:hypothetical protein LTR06_011335 [Exophiala xenobiotica]|nr:hypothetical protein LTR06_011335 [Exophiala xenobiotica]